MILILYHSHKWFENLVGYKLIFYFHTILKLQNTFSSLYSFDTVGGWAPILRRRSPPSRNCQLDPTTKIIFKRVIFVTLPPNNILYCSSWGGKCHKEWHALVKTVLPIHDGVECHKKWLKPTCRFKIVSYKLCGCYFFMVWTVIKKQ